MRATSVVFGLAVLALLLVPLGLSLWLDARWFGAQGLGAIFTLRLPAVTNSEAGARAGEPVGASR